MAKNTGHRHRVGAVKGRSEFNVGNTWYKRGTLRPAASSTEARSRTRVSAPGL